ncbi:hypothetical protein D9M70_438740 [compost metagenome]
MPYAGSLFMRVAQLVFQVIRAALVLVRPGGLLGQSLACLGKLLGELLVLLGDGVLGTQSLG